MPARVAEEAIVLQENQSNRSLRTRLVTLIFPQPGPHRATTQHGHEPVRLVDCRARDSSIAHTHPLDAIGFARAGGRGLWRWPGRRPHSWAQSWQVTTNVYFITGHQARGGTSSSLGLMAALRRGQPQGGGDWSLLALTAANSGVFVLWQLPRFRKLLDAHFLCSRDRFRAGRWWTPVTACFSHEDWSHISSNLVSLWTMGRIVHPVLGGCMLLARCVPARQRWARRCAALLDAVPALGFASEPGASLAVSEGALPRRLGQVPASPRIWLWVGVRSACLRVRLRAQHLRHRRRRWHAAPPVLVGNGLPHRSGTRVRGGIFVLGNTECAVGARRRRPPRPCHRAADWCVLVPGHSVSLRSRAHPQGSSTGPSFGSVPSGR